MIQITQSLASPQAPFAEVRQEAFVDRELVPHEQEEARWTSLSERLIEWKAHPSRLLEEDIEPPPAWLIDGVLRDFAIWRSSDCPPPTSVGPNGEGGIVIAWRFDPLLVEIEIDTDRTVERRKFLDCKLVESWKIPGPR